MRNPGAEACLDLHKTREEGNDVIWFYVYPLTDVMLPSPVGRLFDELYLVALISQTA